MSEHETIKTFSFRHRHKVGSRLYGALKSEYPELEYKSLKVLRHEMDKLSGLKGQYYDCCSNSCCAFTGHLSEKRTCPHCLTDRFNESGKPFCQYQYIDLIPRVQAAYGSLESARLQRYRAEGHISEPGIIKDYMDGKLYKDVCRYNHN